MLGEILTPPTLPDGNLNPKGIQLTSGPICTPLVTVYESMITKVMLCNSSFILEYFITMTHFSDINIACYYLCVFNGQSILYRKAIDLLITDKTNITLTVA